MQYLAVLASAPLISPLWIHASSKKPVNDVLAAFEKETASHSRQSVPFPRLVDECATKEEFEDMVGNMVGPLGFMQFFKLAHE